MYNTKNSYVKLYELMFLFTLGDNLIWMKLCLKTVQYFVLIKKDVVGSISSQRDLR